MDVDGGDMTTDDTTNVANKVNFENKNLCVNAASLKKRKIDEQYSESSKESKF
jgi:hypothetical protein